MATSYLRQGSSGSRVSELQKKLNAAGYSPPLVVDGIFGPKTYAAVRWYQQKNKLSVDGIVGPQTGGSLGLSGFTSTSTSTATKTGTSTSTATTSKQLDLIGVPGQAELWKVGSKSYLVYRVPNSTVRLSYEVRGSELQAMFGPGKKIIYNKTLTASAYKKTGAIPMGFRTELQGEDKHPWDAFLSQYKTEVKTRPWLRDPEVLAVVAAAFLEGRPVTEAELQTTKWFRTRSPAERQWAVLRESDPVAAQQRIQDTRFKVADSLRELGINNAPAKLVNFLAAQVVTGKWTPEQLAQQARKLADPYAPGKIAPELSKLLQDLKVDLDTTTAREDEVRELVTQWLGPRRQWNDSQVARWAGKLRNDPDALASLEDALKKQRLALYPMYENENLSYQDIAAAWEPFFADQWGQNSEHDPDLFEQVLRMNDSVEAGKLLRQQGITRGNEHVANKVLSGMTRFFDPVRESLA